MTPTAFVSHHHTSLHDTGWGHPEHQGRLPALVRAVYRDMLTLHGHLLEVEARPATEEDLLRVHTPGYVRRVREAVEAAAREGRPRTLEGEVVVSGASWDAALAAAGAAVTGVEVVLAGEARNAFCSTRPPGRDAAPDRPGGHSLFNTVAVAARHLLEERGAGRVLVVDWGAEAPLGTPEVFAGEPRVRLVSVHGGAVPPGAGGAEAGAALAEALAGVEGADFVLLSAGFDLLAADPRGGLEVEPREVYDLTLLVREAAERLCGGRLVSVLEGGYAPAETGKAVVQHLRALADLPPA